MRLHGWETPPIIVEITDIAEGKSNPGVLPLIDLQNASPEDCPVGEVGASAGRVLR